jgi:hypothetical protein
MGGKTMCFILGIVLKASFFEDKNLYPHETNSYLYIA